MFTESKVGQIITFRDILTVTCHPGQRDLPSPAHRASTVPQNIDRQPEASCSSIEAIDAFMQKTTSSVTSVARADFGQVQKDDVRGISNGNVMPSEAQPASFLIHLKNSEVISTLVTAVKEIPCWIKTKTSGVIASRPLIRHAVPAAPLE